jgi:hypothetical protein
MNANFAGRDGSNHMRCSPMAVTTPSRCTRPQSRAGRAPSEIEEALAAVTVPCGEKAGGASGSQHGM